MDFEPAWKHVNHGKLATFSARANEGGTLRGLSVSWVRPWDDAERAIILVAGDLDIDRLACLAEKDTKSANALALRMEEVLAELPERERRALAVTFYAVNVDGVSRAVPSRTSDFWSTNYTSGQIISVHLRNDGASGELKLVGLGQAASGYYTRRY